MELQHLSYFCTKQSGKNYQNRMTDFGTEKFSFCLLMLYLFSMKLHGKKNYCRKMFMVSIFSIVYSVVVETLRSSEILIFFLKPVKVVEF